MQSYKLYVKGMTNRHSVGNGGGLILIWKIETFTGLFIEIKFKMKLYKLIILYLHLRGEGPET